MISTSNYVKKSKTSIQNDLRREFILANAKFATNIDA